MQSADNENKVAVSVVTPLYKAEKIVDELVSRISASVSTITPHFEIILVDDRGPDNTWQKIQENSEKDARVKGLRLSRNFGQQVAISAGMRFATGNITVIMDGDLQNPPEEIPNIINILQDTDTDIVYTVSSVRNNKRNEASSKIFWFLMNTVFKLNMVPDQLMMKGFSREFLDIYNSYNERLRVVAGITQDIGMNYKVLPIQNQLRKVGRSNYNFFKRFHLMVDIMLAMTEKPLNFLISLSIGGIIICGIIGIRTLINYMRYPTVPTGYTTLVLLITFFCSTILLVLGIIGRYLSSIYLEVRQRPLFLVKSKINL